jgi:hypothetical protein
VFETSLSWENKYDMRNVEGRKGGIVRRNSGQIRPHANEISSPEHYTKTLTGTAD